MKATTLRLALLLSVLLNLGVAAAVGVGAWRQQKHEGAPPSLPAHLALRADQLSRWRAAEQPFMAQFAAASQQIGRHRAALIDAIFADTVDPALIEAERAAIARLQGEQQGLLIAQLLAEREILDRKQRARLADLLQRQPGEPSPLEELHAR